MAGRGADSLSLKSKAPGPGSYESEAKLHYQKMPGSKIGKDDRRSFFLKTASTDKPAAGKYEIPGFATCSNTGVPKYGFAKDSKLRQCAAGNPGPNHYEQKGTLGDGTPIFSFPGRRADLRPSTGKGVPGSGTYEPSLSYVKRANPKFSVGKSARDGSLGIFKNPPGPGQYQPDQAKNLVRAHSASWK
jgi:hypothetical protein